MLTKDRKAEKQNLEVKVQLEISDINEEDEKTDKLIEQLINSSCSIEREWATIYQIKRKQDKGEINAHQALKAIGKFDPKTPEMRVFTYIIPLYYYLRNAEYSNLAEMSTIVDLDLIENNDDIKRSYYNRLMALLGASAFSQNKMTQARFYCSYGINLKNIDRLVAYSCLTMGNTYILDDYERAKEYFLKGLNHTDNNPLAELQLTRSLCFLENHWGKENFWLNPDSEETTDIQEIAHYQIKRNNLDYAKEILDYLEEIPSIDNDYGIHFYLKGLAYQDKRYFYESIKHFKLSGDLFSVRLPLDQLREMGEDEQILDLLAL
ncbi:AimR family lysis-lysogeny pheromone receptor [Bacillus spizizenii]|nr:AimR family lysis-lysogeny pheromone receptor [Bacillus spizizenii]MCY8255329.1 AimR family lysis-lysogeny pheromone receptor [Bacillus spizizenii]MCY9334284.1 AimR family lysis-lysogeny pheromone receptor [Bacillus spizizenii]MEC0618161.1 AimR family lysis-lysogeny pheromone receptor [Bacillus spizizenii]MEC0641359.1 AimR family lysis-lysogeny pheromone receptor [Bacillus spizizenii]